MARGFLDLSKVISRATPPIRKNRGFLPFGIGGTKRLLGGEADEGISEYVESRNIPPRGLKGVTPSPKPPTVIVRSNKILERLRSNEGVPLDEFLEAMGFKREQVVDVPVEQLPDVIPEGKKEVPYKYEIGWGVHVKGEESNPYLKFQADLLNKSKEQAYISYVTGEPIVRIKSMTPSRPPREGEILPTGGEGWLGTLNRIVTNTANTPVVNVGGIELSIPDILMAGTIAYGGATVAKVGWDALMKKGIGNFLDSFLAERGLAPKGGLLPSEKNTIVNTVINGIKTQSGTIKPNRLKVIQTAFQNLFKGKPPTYVEATAKRIVDDATTALMRRITPQITKFTTTNTGVPGMTTTQANILSSLRGMTPQTAQAVGGGIAKLTPQQPAKESWQMTEGEYIKLHTERVKLVQRARRKLEIAEKYGTKAQVTEATKELHNAEDNMISTILDVARKRELQYAVEQGKPVPPEVLKDYPDLQTMKPATSVQTGLSGLGKESAQVEMFRESNVAAGQGGTKPNLIDIEALKRAQSARPLEGQASMIGGGLTPVRPPTPTTRKQKVTTSPMIPTPKPTRATTTGVTPVQETPMDKTLAQREAESLKALRDLEQGEISEEALAKMEFEIAGFYEYKYDNDLNEFLKMWQRVQGRKDQVNDLTLKEARQFLGETYKPLAISMTDKTHVRWDAMDKVAQEMGYDSPEALWNAIDTYGKEYTRINKMKEYLAKAQEQTPADYAVSWDKPNVTLTEQLKEIYEDIKIQLDATKAGLHGVKGAEAQAHRQIIKTLQKELDNLEHLMEKVNVPTDIKELRANIMTIAKFKGLSDGQLRELFKNKTGVSRLSAMTATQLGEVLDAVRKARPVSIKGRKVITVNTERAIQSLKAELIKQGKINEETYQKIMHHLELSTDRYISADTFITEAEGKSLIRDMNHEAELGLIEWDTKVSEALVNKPQLAEAIGKIKNKQTDVVKVNEDARKYGASPFWDIQIYLDKIQEKTGGRLGDVFDKMATKVYENEATQKILDKTLEKSTPAFKRIAGDSKSLKRINDYIEAKLKVKGAPTSPKDITADEVKLAERIEKDFTIFAPDIRFQRFWRAYNNNDGDIDLMQSEIKDAPREDLIEASRIYERKGVIQLKKYLNTKTWGVIESGYSPHYVVSPRLYLRKTGVGVSGKGHLKSRGGVAFTENDRNILQRRATYIRQMLNLNLEPYFYEFQRIMSEIAPKLSNPSGVSKIIETMIREVNRYPVDNPLARFAMRLGGWTFSTLALAPSMTFRNMLQNFFHPDPQAFRLLLRNKLNKQNLLYFDTLVSQEQGIAKDYLMQEGMGHTRLERMLRRITYYDLAETNVNRKPAFAVSYLKADNALKNYKKNGDVSQFMKDSGLYDLTPQRQRRVLETLALDKVEYNVPGLEAVDGGTASIRVLARNIVTLAHFNYKRWERAPVEQGDFGKVFGSLMTYPRNIGQRIASSGENIKKGTSPQKLRVTKSFILFIIGGAIANQILTRVTGRESDDYNPLNMLTWNPGGLALGSLTALSDVVSDIANWLMGDEYAAGRLVKTIPRLLDMGVPFYKIVMNVVETLTDTKYLDRKALRQLLDVLDETYKSNPDYYKAERDFITQFQHILFGTEVAELGKIELALEVIGSGIKLLGSEDTEAKTDALNKATSPEEIAKVNEKDWTYTMGSLASDIFRTTASFDLDVLTEENGFSPLAIRYWKDKDLIDKYYLLPNNSEIRWQYRIDNPETEAVLIIWRGFSKFASSESKSLVMQYIETYDIPTDVIKALNPQNTSNSTNRNISTSAKRLVPNTGSKRLVPSNNGRIIPQSSYATRGGRLSPGRKRINRNSSGIRLVPQLSREKGK